MMRGMSIFVAGLCALVLASSGCSRKQAKVPELIPVTGTVVIDGKPGSEVRVFFVPQSGTPGNGGAGMTGADGAFSLQHQSGNSGVEAGTYDVIFSKFVMPDGSALAADVQPESVGAKQALPARYTAADTSNVSVTVDKSAGPFNFDLKSR
jgi:hypothetical protein